MEALNAVKRARAGMLVSSPFFGELALKLQLKEDKMEELPPHRRTMWTDGVSLGFNPDYVLRESMEVLEFSLAHEAMHCAMGHQLRRDGRDHDLWNQACDYSVNWILKESGYHVPNWVLLDQKYANKSAEEIFEILHGKREEEQQQQQKKEEQEDQKEEQEEQKEQEDSSPDKADDESSEENDENTDDSDSGEEEQGDGQGEDSDTGEGQDGDDGSGEDEGQDGEGEGSGSGEGEMGDCEGGCGEIRDFPGEGGGVDNGDAEAAHDQEWKSVAAMAQAHAEGCGKCPGFISQMVPELNATKVDWREALQRFVAEQSRNDYSWRRPNSRYAASGFMLPSLFNEELPPIGFAIDTSGSTAEDLSQFASEAEEVLSVYPTTLHVVMADTEVRDVKEYTKEDIPLNLEFKGGGGTKFSPTFRYFNDLDTPITCVIYLTDLQCYDYGPAPDYPVLFVQTEGPTMTPPWGEVIRMKPRF